MPCRLLRGTLAANSRCPADQCDEIPTLHELSLSARATSYHTRMAAFVGHSICGCSTAVMGQASVPCRYTPRLDNYRRLHHEILIRRQSNMSRYPSDTYRKQGQAATLACSVPTTNVGICRIGQVGLPDRSQTSGPPCTRPYAFCWRRLHLRLDIVRRSTQPRPQSRFNLPPTATWASFWRGRLRPER